MNTFARTIRLIGAPTDIGAGHRGASMGPEALRVAGIAQALRGRGLGVDAVSPSAGGHPCRQSDHAAVLGAGGLRPLRDDLCRRRHASRGV